MGILDPHIVLMDLLDPCVTHGSAAYAAHGILDPLIVLISLIPALYIKVLQLHMEVLHMELITSRLRNCNQNVWSFLIPILYGSS